MLSSRVHRHKEYNSSWPYRSPDKSLSTLSIFDEGSYYVAQATILDPSASALNSRNYSRYYQPSK